MNNSDYSDLDAEIINVTPLQKRRGGIGKWIAVAAFIVLSVVTLNGLGVYIEALWFDSVGYGARFWSVFALGWTLFAVFGVLTLVILRGGFYALERFFGIDRLPARKIVLNQQSVDVNPARFLKPLGWIFSLIFSISYAFGLSEDWQRWTLYLHQPATANADPIFGNAVGFYLFSLPVYQSIASWLTSLAVILLIAAIVYALLSAVPPPSTISVDEKPLKFEGFGTRAYSAVSVALGALLVSVAAQIYLSRYAFLWTDHSSFSGVTYTEANYTIPGLTAVAIAFLIAALVLFVNAFGAKGGRLMLFALGIPAVVFVIAGIVIPSYVQNFVVKPNELGKETPYIEHNIAGTRAGFNIEKVESREYAADTSNAAFNLDVNRSTLANIRLWDWRALQDTLRQIQEIRTYYDFPDVDVDRYRINGEMRQVMTATREMDVNKLPEQSRNWINERLVYTHGYGVTMNPVNEFTGEGKPRFILSNMPIEASGDLKVTRPEIYFGEKTDTDVYVKTKQREFDYPQGENNNYTNYEGSGGFAVGGGLRRLAVAWATGDLSKLPFSDDVTAESRVLLHRNISERTSRLAPFLKYDADPYIVVNDDGRLFWIMDAYTSSNRYPYSRHYPANGQNVNYLRNSVKITVDAYSGAVDFYVFDEADPIVAAYRTAFPELFKAADAMPAGLRAHVRYPETLIKTQGDVFGLYHTQSAKMFFGREDVWSIAREASVSANNDKSGQTPATQPLDPYQVLMPLPGEQSSSEFAQVLPFTPANRNNMIAWMAGRSDGAAYGQLLVYNFPSSRVIDGPSQVEARIDQDAQLSGQITLWNQQGSKVKRGNLIIMPIGTGLLYVEPIYLQAERSPMPELRLVVLATQEKLVYAANFETALAQLTGTPTLTNSKEAETKKSESDGGQPKETSRSTTELIKLAGQTFNDYQKLTSEGKLGEAGQKLDELKRILGEMQNR